MKQNTPNPYADMLNLPRPVSKNRASMSLYDRAAQFSPFAALTGYDDAIEETARLTDYQAQLDEHEIAAIDGVLQSIFARLPEPVAVQLTYFQPDILKDGGSYITEEIIIKKVDYLNKTLVLRNHAPISLDAIRNVSIIEKQ